jgi:hypothetical protein
VLQRQSSFTLVFAVTAIVLGSGWYLESRARVQDAARLDTRLARLEHAADAAVEPVRPSRGPTSAARIPPSLIGSGASPFATPGGPNLAPALSAVEQRRLKQQALSRLETRLSADGYDPQWAASTESSAANAADDPTLAAFHAPAASDLHCARSMCRLVFAFDNLDQAEDWLTYYPLGVTKQLPVFQSLSTVLPDGRVELRMYGFRDARTKLD